MDTIVVPGGHTFYCNRTEEQIEAARQRDIAEGNSLDSAGEPRLYSTIVANCTRGEAVATVLRTRKVEWHHWSSKPKFLIEALMDVDGTPRVVMLQDPRRSSRRA